MANEKQASAGGGVATDAIASDPELRAKLGALRQRLHAGFAQTVLAMMGLPRYRHQTLSDLAHLVLDPLIRDRIAVATAKGGGNDAETAGIAIWASVSDAVDSAIREQIKAGAFPVRLKGDDWRSGDTIWLLDVIAPSQKLATAVLANFKQVAGEKPVHVHPIVARSVDPEVLKKLAVKPSASDDKAV